VGEGAKERVGECGIPNAEGVIFLVDNEGKLLAINPTIEEV